MLNNKRIILLLSVSLIIHFASGWVLEGEKIEVWQNIAAWILIYSIPTSLALLIALLTKNEDKLIKLFAWSTFGIFLAELTETAWCRIPNNNMCENDYFSSTMVGLIIIHGIYRMTRIMNKSGERFILGLGLGFSLSKTIFSKSWLGKLFIALTKIISLWF